MTDVFTAGQKEALALFTQGIGKAIDHRFRLQQFENFKANELAKFQQTMQDSVRMIHETSDDDNIQVQGFLNFKQALNEFSMASAAYPGNVMIANAVQQMHASNAGLMEEFQSFKAEGEKWNPTAVQQRKDIRQAGTEVAMMGPERERVEIDKLKKETSVLRPRADAAGSRETWFEGFDTSTPQGVQQALANPRLREERKGYANSVGGEMVDEMLERWKNKPYLKPTGGMTRIGMDPEADRNLAMQYIDKEEWRVKTDRRIMERSGQVDPDDKKYRNRWSLDRFNATKSPALPITTDLMPGNAAVRALGPEEVSRSLGLAGMGGEELGEAVRHTTLKKVAEGLPDSVKDLSAGSLQVPFQAVMRDTGPGARMGINPMTDKPWKGWQDFDTYFKKMKGEAINNAVGGGPGIEITAPMANARKKVGYFYDHMWRKYAIEMADELNIPVPGHIRKEYKKPLLGGLFEGWFDRGPKQKAKEIAEGAAGASETKRTTVPRKEGLFSGVDWPWD
jgi:hypothetical protein